MTSNPDSRRFTPRLRRRGQSCKVFWAWEDADGEMLVEGNGRGEQSYTPGTGLEYDQFTKSIY